MNISRLLIAGAAAALSVAALQAQAAEINYIASSSGYVLGGSGGNAAVTENWMGQAPMHGFSGYGAIQWNGKCLTGRVPQGASGAPMTWEACSRSHDAAQIWALSGKRLNNEGGWCADVEGNRSGAGVRVLAYRCSGAINQQWGSVHVEAISAAAANVNPAVRGVFIDTANKAAIGAVISGTTGHLVNTNGSNILSQGGGNVVKTSPGIVAQGGLN